MNKSKSENFPKKVVEVKKEDDEDIQNESEIEEGEGEGEGDNNVEDEDVNDDSEIEDEADEVDEVEVEVEEDEDDEDEVDEDEDDEDEDDEVNEDGEDGEEDDESITMKKTKKIKKSSNKKNINISGIEMLQSTKKNFPRTTNEDDDDDDNDDNDDDINEEYLQKFDNELRENYILDNHPEINSHNYEEIKALSRVTRDGRGIIIDSLHKTIPILTKYEMTCIIGQRAKQLDSGAKSFVKVPVNVIDGYFIAMLELEQKKIPFIIKRPLPNGGVEYWNVSDLEIIL